MPTEGNSLPPYQTAAEAIAPWLVEIRRDLHMHPELRYEEIRTAGRIAEILISLGVDHAANVGMTGVVGLIRGESDGPTVALRADMDALPIEEENDVPYRSVNPGKMHACGHETHVTMLLGVARMLSETPPSVGNVKLIFQPAEEGGAGALRMIEDGVLQDPEVDAIFAHHVYPDIDVGKVGLVYGTAWASTDALDIEVIGSGCHAARPHLGRDPIVATAHFIQALQTIVSRNLNPKDCGVVTIGKIEGGTARNVIPDRVKLLGTVRALTEETRTLMLDRISTIAEGIARAFDVEIRITHAGGYPMTLNHDQQLGHVRAVATEMLGAENVLVQESSMGGEDFSYFLQRVPGAIYRIGGRGPTVGGNPAHNSHFDVDERMLPIGAALLAGIGTRYLSHGS